MLKLPNYSCGKRNPERVTNHNKLRTPALKMASSPEAARKMAASPAVPSSMVPEVSVPEVQLLKSALSVVAAALLYVFFACTRGCFQTHRAPCLIQDDLL
ncbi:hypothetical protein E1301_Tti019087 [Triplophysa tibetana]|uniref:Uncharacterized protein n=1 Tax=Triplophysa tibetana TaxID=1572043 RepID=A0A5A9NVY5_9TELE|nr:hypothetical protein E1301_Tti019087 [Triplophysa tibetana]